MIKWTRLWTGTKEHTNRKDFIAYIAENGNIMYTVNGNVVSKEEGNKIFKETIEYDGPHHVAATKTIEATNEEILKEFNAEIDKYYQYIDDYKQMEAARKRNERFYTLINEFSSIM